MALIALAARDVSGLASAGRSSTLSSKSPTVQDWRRKMVGGRTNLCGPFDSCAFRAFNVEREKVPMGERLISGSSSGSISDMSNSCSGTWMYSSSSSEHTTTNMQHAAPR